MKDATTPLLFVLILALRSVRAGTQHKIF